MSRRNWDDVCYNFISAGGGIRCEMLFSGFHPVMSLQRISKDTDTLHWPHTKQTQPANQILISG